MKQLLLLGVAAVLAAFVAAGGLIGGSSGTVHADPFNNVFTYKTVWSTLTANSAPDLDVTVAIDCPLGTGACPASTNAPFFDIAVTQYTNNIVGCTGTAVGACPATKIPFDATLGTTDFQLNTNIIAAKLPSNVDSVTGTTAACGGAGTTTLVSTFTIYNSNNAASALINAKDDAQNVDTDSLPDTQADSYGVTAAGALTNGANGVPDGADGLPDYIKLVLDTALPLLSNRGFGVAQIVPQAAQTDVNFLTLNLGAFGAGYAAITTLGDVRPLTVPDADASQATQTCAPFTSAVHTKGTSLDSFGTSWTANGATVVHNTHETPQAVRTITGTAGDPIHYAIDVSSAEDVDGDGIPLTVDKCANPDVGTFTPGLTSASGTADIDGDGMGDSCDPDPATSNNCPGVAFTGRSAACAADASAGPYPTDSNGCNYVGGAGGSPATYTENGDLKNEHVTCTTPWLPDQDVDGDAYANFFDNCPTTYNPQQIDTNSDGVGDACQVLTNTAAGPRPQRPLHDHDDFCDNATAVGGSVTPSTTCYASTAHAAGVTTGLLTGGVAQDSNDDGFADNIQLAGAFNLTDKNSDSDWDGCPDYSEVAQTAANSACGASKGVASVVGPGTECGAGIAICLNPKLANTTGANDCVSYLPSFAIGGPNSVADAAHCTDGGKDDPNGIADARDIAADATQQDIPASSNPNGGDADTDLDGCSNRREVLAAAPIANGGGRDPLNKWDFFDVETNNGGVLSHNKVVNISDTIAILQYIGTSSANPNTPNAAPNLKTYGGDDNNDGVSNGLTFDRSPNGSFTGPPSGAVTIADAISNLNQIGANCSTP